MNRAARVFHAVADLGRVEREAYYAEHGVAGEVRAEVESLLEYDSHASTFLMGGVAQAAEGIVEAMEKPERCGAFRPVKLLGRGGMGSVWLAERIDREVDQKVAVKVLRAGSPTARQQERFIQERRILASLSHPNIARLLDAGQTDSGQPFLAMEYVEGVAIDRFCEHLDRRSVLRIVLKVCAAVAYAHRNLVIHRDLKPSNILVTAEGEPKLLDFGIAKLMNFTAERTTTVERVLTPDYASPEQVKGLNTGTATDVYSLGGILYKLLTGQSPHAFEELHPAAMAAAICDRGARAPSEFDKALAGDLDSILLKALRKEPEERYASVEKLAEDLENHLEFRPVRARSGNVLYLGRRFLRRHWLAVTGPAVAMAGLAAGLLVAQKQRGEAEAARAVAESRRVEAQQERDRATRERAVALEQEAVARQEREEAQRQRGLADKRYREVRQIALRLLDLDREMQKLAGATKARQALVTSSLEYLERLEAESADDAGFRLELAEAYRKVAQVQGAPGFPNLGQTKAALDSLGKAERILAPMVGESKARLGLLDMLDMRARILGSARDWEGTLAAARKGLRVAEEGGKPAPGEMVERMASLAYSAQAASVNMDRPDEGLRYGRMSVDFRRELYRQRGSPASATNLASALLGLASTMRFAGELSEALEHAGEGRRVIEERYGKSPSLQLKRTFSWALYQEARVLGSKDGISLGRWEEAAELLERSLTLTREIAAADAEDTATRNNLAHAAGELADLRLDADAEAALRLYDEARKRREELPGHQPGHADKMHMMAGAVRALVRLGRMEEAGQRLEELMRVLGERKLYPGAVPAGGVAGSALRAKAEWEEARGNRAGAKQVWEEMAAGFEAAERKADGDLQWAVRFSEVYRALGRLDGDAKWREKDRGVWAQWARKLPANRFVGDQLRASR
ncbi:MAG: serine/threonine protein kinase [Bryobacterales bacterium]|nr:serine/threonine protein kinase [Bryobacterales bacterium]